ncbi:hypothetical protein [Azonexus sp.]|uniref:hypothetical protein n=1 Tax=Azonexus sp. TaxID=1872668 RepID=UPI00281B176F|nr:hypothetical protein [Azonexus sp.]MDR1995144.1 hypothetical protein [Azonexus sp.]
MADGYQISFPELDTVASAFTRAPEVVGEEMNRFFDWALHLLKSEVVDRTPAAAGTLRDSIFGRTEATPSGILGIIGTTLDYAPAVELGTRPHPVSKDGILALAEWAKRKLPLGRDVSMKTGRPLKSKGIDETALSAAHAIAWKIKHHGTQGAFMFRDAFQANQGRVAAEFRRMAERIVARLGSTA